MKKREYDREIDAVLALQLQSALRYILSCFAQMVEEVTGKRIIPLKRRVGHDVILLEQILRGNPPHHILQLWQETLRRDEELTLENLVKFLEGRYPLVRSEWETFKECANELVERHRGLAVKVAQHVSSQIYHVEIDDLIGEANLAVIGAALRYKPSFKTNFSTYAFYVIKSWLMDFSSRNLTGLSLPPTAYSEMKKQNSRISVYLASQLEDLIAEENIVPLENSDNGDSIFSPYDDYEYDHENWNEREIMDIVRKLPQPFRGFCYLIVSEGISSPNELSEITSIDPETCKEIFNILRDILSKFI